MHIVMMLSVCVCAVIENMCGQGNTIGGSFSELSEIIDLVQDKSRMGVCLDTCHAFAAGEKVFCIVCCHISRLKQCLASFVVS